MFKTTIDRGEVFLSTKGERTIVLAEALCCVDVCKDFLKRNMNISQEEAVALIVESMTRTE